MPRSMAMMAASSTGGPGRAAMSVSLSLAVIMRSAAVRGASLASMEVLSSAVNRSRRLMAGFLCVEGFSQGV